MTAAPALPVSAPWGFSHRYAEALPRGVIALPPERVRAPALAVWNRDLAARLGLPASAEREAAQALSGLALPADARPVAQAYSGHQFGGFSPVLGDGRAHLLGEVSTPDGLYDIALKGSGRTPFSRSGDGKAALGPMLREYVMGEAMAALGVPTTRALAVLTTGETVRRDTALPGAILARVAASHIRVGTFQYFASRQDVASLRALLDHAIARHYPELSPGDGLGFLNAVIARQARLVAQWMGLGFIHGVMNTDNMAVSGETIDYGPCAFMEAYAPGTVFSSIDHQGRYSHANQPLILGWNLARLAECLLGFIDPDQKAAVDKANAALGGIAGRYRAEWVAVMRGKLGLSGEAPEDGDLADAFLSALEGQGADWTLAFRRLAEAAEGDATPLRMLAADPAGIDAWLPRWRARLGPDAARRLRAANPLVIPRNHMVEEALDAATEGDMAPFHRLLDAVTRPFEARPGFDAYALPAPQGLAPHVTFCGT